MFNIKYMYAHKHPNGFVNYEEVIEKMMVKEEIAELFVNKNVIFIQVNGILHGRRFDRSWTNNYLGFIENFILLHEYENKHPFEWKTEYDL